MKRVFWDLEHFKSTVQNNKAAEYINDKTECIEYDGHSKYTIHQKDNSEIIIYS